MHVSLQGKQQVSEEPLMHGGPFEFWDAEHCGARPGAELAALLLRHGHAPETQVNAQVSLQLCRTTTMEGLQQTQPKGVGGAVTHHKIMHLIQK